MIGQDEIKTLVQNKVIPGGATIEQIKYFLKVCEKKRLDPFLKQVHMIERSESDGSGGWKKSYTIQASLDGMRAIAQRNCKIISYKRAVRHEGEEVYGICEIETADRGKYYDEVPYSEYVQKKKDGSITKFWKQFPTTMIKKVAEESVLRMLAPEDLSGVYGDEEMEQADHVTGEIPETVVRQIEAQTQKMEHSVVEEASYPAESDAAPFLKQPQKPAPVSKNGKSFDTFDPAAEEITFGKNKDLLWKDCDLGYLQWMSKNGQGANVQKALATINYLKQSQAQMDQSDPMDAVFGKAK